MTNEEAKIHLLSAKLMLLGADGQPVSDLYYAVEKGIEAIETIPKYKDAYNKGWDDGAKATYEHLKMCEEEQSGDLISRQAVLDMMQMRMSGKELYKAVYELPSINPQEPNWVPVSERLPKNRNQEVLISLEWGIDIGRYSDGEWHSEWINYYDDRNVLAWMPLPKPYEPQTESKGEE